MLHCQLALPSLHDCGGFPQTEPLPGAWITPRGGVPATGGLSPTTGAYTDADPSRLFFQSHGRRDKGCLRFCSVPSACGPQPLLFTLLVRLRLGRASSPLTAQVSTEVAQPSSLRPGLSTPPRGTPADFPSRTPPALLRSDEAF